MPGETMTDTTLIYQDNTPDLRFELYRGRLVQQSIPTNVKNRICQFLLFKLQQYFSTQSHFDLITLSNVGVRTGLDTSRVPDLMVCPQKLWQVVGDRPGAAVLNFGEIPMLAIEIQENRADYLLKKAEYALIEIPEVWMIDPEKQRIRVWTNPHQEDGYEHQDYFSYDAIGSTQFPDLNLTVDEVLHSPSYAELMQVEVDANASLQDEYSREWQKMAAARSAHADLQEQYQALEELVHNELQEKSILLELLEDKGIDLKQELPPGEFAMFIDDIEARKHKDYGSDLDCSPNDPGTDTENNNVAAGAGEETEAPRHEDYGSDLECGDPSNTENNVEAGAGEEGFMSTELP